jgi:hypothetical protein
VVDAAVGAGADSVSGPALSRGDSAGLYREALRAAVDDAKAKAQALAAASKLTLGEVTSVAESGAAPVPLASLAGKAADSGSVVIEPGTTQVQASVSVTFSAT